MPVSGALIAARMQLTGQKAFAAGMERSAAATTALGNAATTTAAKTKAAGAGINAMMGRAATGVSSMKKHGAAMSAAGGRMSSSFAVPFAVIAAGSIKMSMDFWGAMRLIQTSAGATEDEMYKLGDSVLALAASGRVKESPEELAKALYKVVSGGYKGAEAMSVLEKASQLATVSQSDLEQTTLALVAAQNTGIKGTQNIDETIGTLNATVGAGNMVMNDLTSAFASGVIPSAAAVGLSLTDVGAAIATMTKRGVPASKAANNMKLALTKMASPSGSALEALESIGLSQHDMATAMRGPRGLPTALGLLQSKLKGLSKNKQTDIINAAFGGARGGSTMLTLLQNLDDVNGRFNSIRGNANKLKGDLKDVQNARGFKLKAALTQLKSAMIQLGDVMGPVLVPMLTKLVGWLGKGVKMFGKLPKPIQTGVTVILALLGVAGPVLMFFGALFTAASVLAPVFTALGGAIMFMLSPVGLIILGIAALAVGFYLAYKKVGWFRDGVDAVFKWLKTAVVNVVGWVKKNWQLLVAFILGPVTLIGYAVYKNWDRIKKATKNAWNFVKRTIINVVRGVINFVRNHWNLIVGIILGPMALVVGTVIKNWGKIKAGAGATVNFIKEQFNSVVSFFASMPGRIASAASGLFDGIKNAFKSAINWIIERWNGLEFKIPGIDPPGPGSIPGVTVGTPDIPLLAMGGTATMPGSVIVGDRGPELLHIPRGATVEPLGRPTVGEAARNGYGRSAGRTGRRDIVVPVTVQVDRKTIAKVTARAVEDEEARR